MPLEQIPPETQSTLAGLGVAAASGLVGRILYHTRQAQRGRRQFFSWALALELPMAIGCGWIAYGATTWLKIEGMPAQALIAALSYLGPGFIEAVVWRLIDRTLPAKD